MKTMRLLLILVLGLLLMGCSVEGETVTATSTALSAGVPTRVVVIATAVPPTHTPTQLPATETPMPTGTAVPADTATQPTEVATVQPASIPPSIEGALFFFWDTETPLEEPAYYAIPLYEPKQDLYIAVPGDSPENWQTSSLLKNQLNWPDETTGGTATLSPDQSMIAFTVHKRIDSNTDVVSIYVVNLLDGTVGQLTEDYFPRIYNISWLPDNQTVAYSLEQAGFLANPADAFSEQFTPTFPTDISKLRVSPDGQFAAECVKDTETTR